MKLMPPDERYIGLDQVIDLLDLSTLLDRRPAKLSIPVLYVSHSIEEIILIAQIILVSIRGQLTAARKTQEVVNRCDFQETTGTMALKN